MFVPEICCFGPVLFCFANAMDEAEVSGNDVPGLEGRSRKKLKLVRPDRRWRSPVWS